MSTDLFPSNLKVVMFPWFAFGHINPFVQLSNKLSAHGVQVTFFSAPGNIARIKNTLKLSPDINIVPLSIPHIDGLPPNIDSTADLTPSMSELLKQALDLMQPQVKALLTELKPHFVFFDFAQHWLPAMASQLGIKTIAFSVFASSSNAYVMVPSRLKFRTNQKSCNISDLVKPPQGFPVTSINSLKAHEAKDLTYVFKNFHGNPSVYERVMDCLNNSNAMVMRTLDDEMERPYIDYISSQFQKPVLSLGPLVSQSPPAGELEEKWANWLGKFPPKSVIYCSFGSETFLNKDQIQELALGLELTGSPFILVLNFPAHVDGPAELDKALPEGFLERVKDRGIGHIGWVQQQLILAHEAVGCFVCHSGFSSVIEALVNDRQLVLLPFKNDQFFNSKWISGDMKAGVEVNRREEDGHFGQEDIMEAVSVVMSDKEASTFIRANHKKWRELLLNGHIQNKLIIDLVEQLKAMTSL
ncbi:UDPGT domain-containing protein [Cephalotus follicularis]|uniref:Glycosyltransferase n=1 Tax=Cephalotus follicularis TaxID=3775 RepID=A0A1Q3CDC9_CEPFO|nr:UDPGT domain-containing protein [Cephalotus follicularis]